MATSFLRGGRSRQDAVQVSRQAGWQAGRGAGWLDRGVVAGDEAMVVGGESLVLFAAGGVGAPLTELQQHHHVGHQHAGQFDVGAG